MLAFVPVTLDLYRTVRRHLHWTLQNLVAFADRTGRCFPSVRSSLRPRDGERRCPATGANWPRRASSRASGALAASTPMSSRGRFLPAQRGVSH